jgi:hypothetical protein
MIILQLKKWKKVANFRKSQIFNMPFKSSTPAYFLDIMKDAIFSKNAILMGGLTFVRAHSSQVSKHHHYLVRVCFSLCNTNKSSTPIFYPILLKK